MDVTWLKYIIINKARRTIDRILPPTTLLGNWKKYAGKTILNINETNNFIKEKIVSQKEFMICRFGYTEMSVISSYLQHTNFNYIDTRSRYFANLCEKSGFFPNDINLCKKFVKLIIESTKQIDLCGVWNLHMEDYLLTQYAPGAKVALLEDLEPWSIKLQDLKGNTPWTSVLKGKKVLVIHPFEQSIIEQYAKNREKIFERIYEADDILPQFELKTIKAVQSLNCNIENNDFDDWFAALDSMIEQCRNTDFDIAIIGCGAYGLPLAAEIKKMGKGAIHLGGATQLLFGIMGDRWNRGGNKLMMDRMINEAWVHPTKGEQLKNAEKIENACYW